MTETAEAHANSFFVLKDANSQKVFWGQLISQSCDKLMSVGMIWVLCADFSSKWVPWFIAIGALPHFLLATKSGHWISSWGALKTIIWTDLIRAVLFIAIAAAVPFFQSKNELLMLLMASAFVSNIAGALFNPAILSLPLDLMEPGDNRDKLTALIDSCFAWGNVLGPLVSALTYAWVGLAGMLAINGLSYLFSFVLALAIKLPESKTQPENPQDVLMEPHSEQQNPQAQTKSIEDTGTDLPKPNPPATAKGRSLQELLKSQPVISGMLLTFLFMNFFLAPLMIFMPWYAKNVYAEGIAALAKLEFFLGIGTVAGGMLLSFVKLPGATWKRVSVSLCLMSIAYLCFTFTHYIWFGCIAVLFLGFFLSLANVVCLTFFQSAPDPDDVPVVMGMVNLISVASLPISMGIIGSFIETVPVPQFAAMCAGLVIGIALVIPFIPGIRKV